MPEQAPRVTSETHVDTVVQMHQSALAEQAERENRQRVNAWVDVNSKQSVEGFNRTQENLGKKNEWQERANSRYAQHSTGDIEDGQVVHTNVSVEDAILHTGSAATQDRYRADLKKHEAQPLQQDIETLSLLDLIALQVEGQTPRKIRDGKVDQRFVDYVQGFIDKKIDAEVSKAEAARSSRPEVQNLEIMRPDIHQSTDTDPRAALMARLERYREKYLKNYLKYYPEEMGETDEGNAVQEQTTPSVPDSSEDQQVENTAAPETPASTGEPTAEPAVPETQTTPEPTSEPVGTPSVVEEGQTGARETSATPDVSVDATDEAITDTESQPLSVMESSTPQEQKPGFRARRRAKKQVREAKRLAAAEEKIAAAEAAEAAKLAAAQRENSDENKDDDENDTGDDHGNSGGGGVLWKPVENDDPYSPTAERHNQGEVDKVPVGVGPAMRDKLIREKLLDDRVERLFLRGLHKQLAAEREGASNEVTAKYPSMELTVGEAAQKAKNRIESIVRPAREQVIEYWQSYFAERAFIGFAATRRVELELTNS